MLAHQRDKDWDLKPSCQGSSDPHHCVILGADLGWQRHRCHWQWVSPPPLPRGARCWLFPCCWLTCCASSCPRRWVWRPAAADPLHLAAEHLAQPEASGSRKSYLEQQRRRTVRQFYLLHIFSLNFNSSCMYRQRRWCIAINMFQMFIGCKRQHPICCSEGYS